MKKAEYNPATLITILFVILAQIAYGQDYKLICPEIKNPMLLNYGLKVRGADISTTCQYFDRKGFFWSGTNNSLHRFDGIDYKNFFAGYPDGHNLAGKYITDIYEDYSGDIWVATFGALHRLDQKTWRFRYYWPDSTNLADPCNTIFDV